MKPVTTFFLAAACAVSCAASEPDRTIISSSEPVPTGTIQEVRLKLKQFSS